MQTKRSGRNRVAMKFSLFVIPLVLIAVWYCEANAQQCSEYGPTVSLTGRLNSRIFPGPPNYESIRKGNRKETVLLLTLDKRICTSGNDPQGIDVPEAGVSEVQLAITNQAHWKVVRRLTGKRVVVTGTLFHGHTGHHRTKVLIEVGQIRAAG